MDAKTNFKARLPSRRVTEGPARAPHRPYAGIPFLTTTLPRHGSLRGDGMIVTGRTAAENLKPVQSNPNNAETISYADA
jgi:dihydroxyacid dehydratase/phosphogluconate dehydratase